MGISKGLLLGAGAAMLMATGSAFAADLPSRKAAPVAYVKICDVYGRGFYYIPGTNTCLRVGGRVRVEYGWRRAQNTANNNTGVVTSLGRQLDTLGWKARAYINMDARTQTAWGTVQTVFSVAIRSRSGIFNVGGGPSSRQPGGNNAASPQVYAAYIRFAGFTFGRAPGTFSSGPGYLFYQTNYDGGSAIGALQLTYTAVFGGGFSASISLEDKNDSALQNRGRNNNGTTTGAVANLSGGATWLGGGATSVSPNRLPNLVLTLRLDQGWGYVRVSGAVGQNNAVRLNGAGVAAGSTRTKTGWAVGADTQIKLPSISKGTSIWLSAAYANGLLDYVTGGNAVNGSIAKDGRITGGWQPGMQNVTATGAGCVGFGPCALTNWKALRAMAALSHSWTPTLRSNFALSYMRVTPGASDFNGVGFLGFAGSAPKSSVWQTSANLIWSPTSGFDIGLEVFYANIKHTSSAALAPAVNANLAAGGVARNPTDLGFTVRVERTF